MGGVSFDLEGLTVNENREGPVAGGSASFAAQVGKVRIKLKLDVGFDSRPVFDVAEDATMPSVLPHLHDAIPIRKVPFSWTLADKVQALVRHGENTTRFRDFYDMFVLLKTAKADPEQTADALVRTFALFRSEMPGHIDGFAALTDRFVERNRAAWLKECRSRKFFVEVPDLAGVVETIRDGLEPILERANVLRASMAQGPSHT